MKRALVVLCLAVGLAGCIPQNPNYEANPATLESFNSAAALAGFYNGNAPGVLLPNSLDWLLGDRTPQVYLPSYTQGMTVPYDPTYGSIGGLAGTSIPALWANELDSARMQGDYLYVLDDYGMSVVKAVPADQMKVVGRFTPSSSPSSLYLLDGLKAVLITPSVYVYNYGYPDPEAWLPDGSQYFDVYVLDLQDPANPAPLAHYSIQGSLVVARVIGGNKLVALSADYPDMTPYSSTPVSTNLTVDQILPQYRLTDAAGTESIKPLLSWKDILRPANPDGNAVLAVTTIDLANPASQPSSTGMLGYWESAYATPTSLYLTNTPYLPDNGYRTTTEIHRFDITSQAPRYAGSIKVTGRPARYDAMYEVNGQLRLVTIGLGNLTMSDLLSGDVLSGNAVYYLLNPTDSGLEIASQMSHIVEGIIPSYANPLGSYVVVNGTKPDTTDPISYVVSMADATQPTLLGESPLPADWANMQMLDANHLLALGPQWDASADPYDYVSTYKICLYDVTQILQPVLLDTAIVGGGYTNSNYTWNFQGLYLADGLFVLPIDLYEGTFPTNGGQQTFGGLYAYRISVDNGIKPVGRVETADAYRYVTWSRAFVKDNILYAVTNAGVRAVNLDDMSTVLSFIRLP